MDCDLYVELLPEYGDIVNKPVTLCPVDWALRVADITRMNNCGKSVMCRDGMHQLYTIILDITTEKGQPEDIDLLMDICVAVSESQGCGIAAKAAFLIRESIVMFRSEWEAHIRRKRCSALVCKGYTAAPVLPDSSAGTRRRKRKPADDGNKTIEE